MIFLKVKKKKLEIYKYFYNFYIKEISVIRHKQKKIIKKNNKNSFTGLKFFYLHLSKICSKKPILTRFIFVIFFEGPLLVFVVCIT